MRKLPPHFRQGKSYGASSASLDSLEGGAGNAAAAALLSAAISSERSTLADPVISAYQHQIRLATERSRFEELKRVQSEFASYLESSSAADQILHHIPHDLRLDVDYPMSEVERQLVKVLLERSLDRPLRDVTEGLSRGSAWFQVGDVERALHTFDRALVSFGSEESLSEGSLKLRLNQGHCYFKLGRFEEAKEAFKQVLRQQRANACALGGYGRALAELGQHSSAIVAFNRALEAEPEDANLHYQLGKVLLAVGCVEQALSSLNIAHRKQPHALGILHELGRAQAQSGLWGEAACTLDLALAISRGCEPIDALNSKPSVARRRADGPRYRPRSAKRRQRARAGWSTRLTRRPSRTLLVLISMYVGHLLLGALGF